MLPACGGGASAAPQAAAAAPVNATTSPGSGGGEAGSPSAAPSAGKGASKKPSAKPTARKPGAKKPPAKKPPKGKKPPAKKPPAKKPPAKKPPAKAPSGAGSAAAGEVVRLVNVERGKAGCSALKVNSKLTTSAQRHAADMAAKNYFSHNSQDGRSPFDRMKAAGYRYSTAGENIAAGQKTPSAVMTSWMNSPGHRANILRCSFKEIGIGIAKGGSYGIYWVQNFGSP